MKCNMCSKETNRDSELCKKCEINYVEEMKKQQEEDIEDYYGSIF